MIVIDSEPSDADPSQAEEPSLKDFLARPRVDNRFIRGQEEIDDYLRAERESWDCATCRASTEDGSEAPPGRGAIG